MRKLASVSAASIAGRARGTSDREQVREVNEPVRQGLRELIHVARVEGRPAFIFVNNRLDGNSPGPDYARGGARLYYQG